MMPASTPKLADLALKSQLDPHQLHQMEIELDLVTIAIAALTPLERVRIEQIAKDLQLESLGLDWLCEWLMSRVTPSRQLAPEQLRALVLVLGQLARDRQTLIRQNISNWQQTLRNNQLPLQSPSLADYIGNFITIYQDRVDREAARSFELLSESALNLSIDLLFYSSATGHQRLWGALLQRVRSI